MHRELQWHVLGTVSPAVGKKIIFLSKLNELESTPCSESLLFCKVVVSIKSLLSLLLALLRAPHFHSLPLKGPPSSRFNAGLTLRNPSKITL